MTTITLRDARKIVEEALQRSWVSFSVPSPRGQQGFAPQRFVVVDGLEKVAALVAQHLGVTPEQLKGPRRPDYLCGARFAYYWLARHLTLHSAGEIGLFIGRRDHGTVLHGVKVCQARLDTVPAYAALVRQIEREVVL